MQQVANFPREESTADGRVLTVSGRIERRRPMTVQGVKALPGIGQARPVHPAGHPEDAGGSTTRLDRSNRPYDRDAAGALALAQFPIQLHLQGAARQLDTNRHQPNPHCAAQQLESFRAGRVNSRSLTISGAIFWFPEGSGRRLIVSAGAPTATYCSATRR